MLLTVAIERQRLYGLMAEFETAEALLAAARKAHEAGYSRMDAFTPLPVEGLSEAVGFHSTRLPLIVLIGGILGGLGGFYLQYYPNVIRIPAEHRGKALEQLAGVHSHYVRDDGAGCGAGLRFWHAGAERVADALSSRLQRAEVPAGHQKPVLSLHQSAGSPVRSRTDQGVLERDSNLVRFPKLKYSGTKDRQASVSRVPAVPCWFSLRRPCECAVALCALALAGCRLDMHVQPKYKPLDQSSFFDDDRSARPVIPDTVARGHLRSDELLYTGKVNGALADTFPFPITRQDLDRGRERYNIYCAPCHGRLGDGQGMIVQRGFSAPPSYHIGPPSESPGGPIL